MVFAWATLLQARAFSSPCVHMFTIQEVDLLLRETNITEAMMVSDDDTSVFTISLGQLAG